VAMHCRSTRSARMSQYLHQNTPQCDSVEGMVMHCRSTRSTRISQYLRAVQTQRHSHIDVLRSSGVAMH
jgi:ribulose-5-phosphate 4-epimerase/fuculose-1-phosphate aldolase